MPKINCFDGINIKELKDTFDKKVSESMPTQQQKEIGIDLVINYYKQLQENLNIRCTLLAYLIFFHSCLDLNLSIIYLWHYINRHCCR